MNFSDIIGFMKNGTKWTDIKAAQEFFENKDDLDAFLKSGWSLQDIKEAKEMVETNPITMKVDNSHFETAVENININNNVSTTAHERVSPSDIITKIAKGEN